MRWIILISLLVFHGDLALSAELIIYPDAPPPYNEAFSQMIAGIEQSRGTPAATLALKKNYQNSDLQHWLSTHRSPTGDSALILLGAQSLQAGIQMDAGLPLVVGGTTHLPNHVKAAGVSLVIDPNLFFQTLDALLPTTHDVIVFYNARNSFILPPIMDAATQHGMTLHTIPITDAIDAIRKISQVFEQTDVRRTAFWFTLDTLELDTTLLFPFVLEKTWDLRIPAFSGIISHTQRGLLFSLYPDFSSLARS